MRTLYLVGILAFIASPSTFSAEPAVLDSMDALTFKQPKEKAAVELVDGKLGKALKFSFGEDCKNIYCYGTAKGSADWDAAAGISFWVKGDGSNHCGGIEFIWNEDYSLRYGYAFSIQSTEWKKVEVPWSDFIPETCNEKARPLGKGENAPSKLGAIAFGKWWYWRDYAAHSYCIDDLRLEPFIAKATIVRTAPLRHVSAKFKAGQPITIVTMGDSLTDFAHWANKPVNWPTLLKEQLHAKYGSEITLINPALGGTELRQNLVLMPRWLQQAPEPDLVTVWFGGNDWNSGMRGPMFAQTLRDAVQRILRETHGKADVLLMTTCPSVEHWDTLAELAEAVRSESGKSAGLADIYSVFHEAGKTGKEFLYCRDKTHLAPAGHELVAKTVAKALE